MGEASLEDLLEVMEEKTAYPIMHVFLPALLYIYLQNTEGRLFKVISAIYLFETYEYIISIVNNKWAEPIADTLVSDILMAFIGIAAAELVLLEKPTRTMWRYRYLHVFLLCATTFCIVTFLSDKDTKLWIPYTIYCGVYVILALVFTHLEWALFSLVNMGLIALMATEGFSKDFEDTSWVFSTPWACLYIVPSTSILYTLYRQYTKRIVAPRRNSTLVRASNFKIRV